MAKYKAKDVMLLTAAQSVVGTPVVPADTDALLATEISYKDNINKDTQVYMGDSLSRDEENTILDHYAELSAKFFMPSRGATAPAAPANFLWNALFNAAGAATSVTGTDPNKIITITNTTAVSTRVTNSFRESSLDVPTQREYVVFDSMATCDLTIEVLKRAELMFNLKGNFTKPVQVPAIEPNYGARKALAATTLRSSNIIAAELTGLIGGFAHTGLAGTVKNICFYKISAPNLFGSTLDRLNTSCETSWDRTNVGTDVTISILKDNALGLLDESATEYDPYNHIEGADRHQFSLLYGLGTGKNVGLYMDEIQLVDIQDSKYGNFSGYDLKFRNTGKTTLTLR